MYDDEIHAKTCATARLPYIENFTILENVLSSTLQILE
jgi:hypothetical protein